MLVVTKLEKIIINKAFRMFGEVENRYTTVIVTSEAFGIDNPHFYYCCNSKQNLIMAILLFSKSSAQENKCVYDYGNRLFP